jgi:hypothetical protein
MTEHEITKDLKLILNPPVTAQLRVRHLKYITVFVLISDRYLFIRSPLLSFIQLFVAYLTMLLSPYIK